MRGGAIVGALAVGGTLAVLPEGGAAQPAALTAARKQTYTALMEAVVVQPSLRLDPAVAPRAADDFAAVYETWPDERRRQADAILDALEREPATAAFSGLDRGRRSAELHDGARVEHARPTGAEHDRLELTSEALELAAVSLGQPDSGHEIVTVG